MMAVPQENEAVVRRFFEQVVNKRMLELVDEIIADNFLDHTVPPGTPTGPDGMKQFLRMVSTAFPDLRINVDDMVASGDKVAVRLTIHGTHRGDLMGIAPTNKEATWTGLDIIRVQNRKFVERWGLRDFLAMYQQLGVVTLPGRK